MCIYKKIWKLFIITGIFIIQGCTETQPKMSTAAENVFVLEQTFTIPDLERQRTIRIYLPEGYKQSQDRYPVLYMHDGQNLFDDKTSYAGEWGVDETMNHLAKENGLSLIVVGIDNGQELRMNELSPWPNKEFGAAEGESYMNFIVDIIKPYIDDNYRTLTDKENTAIMGSSMGGLISHYAIFNYPEIFSKAGIFSPSFWFSEAVYPFSDPKKLSENSRLYYLIGDKEGDESVANMKKMTHQLIDKGFSKSNLIAKVVKDGDHSEHFWKTEFPEAILWLFEGNNKIGK
ncbi:MAG: alpha/beta hydrolase [Gammaproteobacteria bacterium]|nr:alpha/beta hydrolase [Gammaproteobacteria bacterium]